MSRHCRDVRSAARSDDRKGLVTYVTAGDPDLARSAGVIRALARGGADVIEVGVPFSDPIADGPAIQRASERALAAGGDLAADARPGRPSPRGGARADRAVHVRESGAADGRRSRSSAAPPTPASTACCCSICRSRSQPAMRDALDSPRHRSDLSRQSDDDRRAAAGRPASWAADSCTRFRAWA